jgi:predicted TIM-barrel fold metal-dependent hydrolase
VSFQDIAAVKLSIPSYNALAIGLPGVGNYDHQAFKRECDKWGFEGIAAVTTVEDGHLEREFDTILELGFRGVKVHPRLLKRNTDLSFLTSIFSLCHKNGLVCLLCTYETDKPGSLPNCDPFYQICDALNEVPETRLILMHGGGPRLLQFAGLARHSESILIDLSFTIVDYMTIPLRPVIRDLMLNLDRRLCVGSDSPEHQAVSVLHQVEELVGDIDSAKLDNVLSKNLYRFFPKRFSP